MTEQTDEAYFEEVRLRNAARSAEKDRPDLVKALQGLWDAVNDWALEGGEVTDPINRAMAEAFRRLDDANGIIR
jgi:hypothetical protein